MDKYEAAELDLSPLLTPNVKFAVRCETVEEAACFIAAVKMQFPHKRTLLESEFPRWDNDNGGREGGRAYFPDLNNVEHDDFLPGTMQFAVQEHYTIVYFKQLLDHEQIVESDIPIDLLLSGNI